MTLKIYQVDAFTDSLFGGNSAAIVPLTHWLPDDLMQQIAAENNLAETAFYCPEKDRLRLRWFTPFGRSTALRTCHPGVSIRAVSS
jgi:PhzF family phenazine biosynthesis protein